ncbi:cytochrome P450 [Apiospora saccharicola]|uniref:Cytochrome P450 n=1 Tax=Apiospora saccharicola TaxID=335842 RepID=A0ABR1VP23_9PEZI
MLLPLVAAAVALTVTFLYRKLQFLRFQQHANLPQHATTLVLGHLRVFGDYVKRNKPDAHPDMAIVAMSQALGRPPLMFIDMRPIALPMVVVADHDIADQFTKPTPIFPTSPPKSSRSLDRLQYMLGLTSIFSTHGDEWKVLRKRFNPGFSPQYLLAFVPETLDKGLLFMERLEALSKTGGSFSMMKLTTQLTFDIIGKVVMEADLDAQHDSQGEAGELVELFETLVDAYNGDRLNLPWWLNPAKTGRRAALSSRINNLLQSIVSRKYTELHNKEGKDTEGSRSVLSMALQDVETLTPRVMEETCDQLRTFLFAGHDSTATLLSWAIYELSRTPHALRAVRAELDTLLGGDANPVAVRAILLERTDLSQQMHYIAAVIKETLRLHPPGGTARAIPPGSGLTVRMPDGQQQCLDGLLVYNCHSLIHTDPKTYGPNAGDFVPERWLSTDASKSVPAGAWRPFERGPRNCIGQELANLEARVILALTARHFDFCKVGMGEVVKDENGQPRLDANKQGQYQVGEELYMIRQITSKPADGMMMTVGLAQ